MENKNGFTGSGISEELVINFKEYQEMIKSLYCCICLDIVKSPFECENCESLYCEDCWEVMKIAGRKCVLHCTTPVKKANKFVMDMLNKLKLKCETCGKSGISYDIYIKHIDACLLNQKISTVDELTKTITEKDMRIDELMAEIENLKLNGTTTKGNSDSHLLSINTMSKEQLRQQLMSFNLPVNQKMELYNSAVEGKIGEFKDLIYNKRYPILEEVSAHNYYWTSLHYAMHYGQNDIIYFILEYLKTNNLIEMAMKLQSDDGRCPLLCLLRSNSLNIDKKKDILDKIVGKYFFEISNDARKEIRNRDMENILKKYNRQ
jgi:hypothetical protein